MVKLVAFDWNGTILADTMLCWRISDAGMKKFRGSGISFEQWTMTFDVPVTKYYLANGFTMEQIEQHGHEWSHFFFEHYVAGEVKTRTRAGAREILEYLHASKIQRVIFSNHPKEMLDRIIGRLRLEHYFDHVIGNESIHSNRQKRYKKDKLYSYISEKKIKMSDVILIGDTREEIEIGREWGAITVAITGGNSHIKVLKEAKPDFLIHNLKDLKTIIERLSK